MSWDFAPKDVARMFYTEDNPASRAQRYVHGEGWGRSANANQALHHALVGANRLLPHLGRAVYTQLAPLLGHATCSNVCARRIFAHGGVDARW